MCGSAPGRLPNPYPRATTGVSDDVPPGGTCRCDRPTVGPAAREARVELRTDAEGVTADGDEPPPLRRAVILMTASSFLVPAGGLLTQPILAHGLGVSGRGELAAALSPALLAVAVATLGLPDALTYYLAKHPWITRPALLWATVASLVLGCFCVLATFATLPFLSTGDARLGRLILLAVALAVPALVVGVFRGAATGRQMWTAVAVERLVSIVVRVAALVVLVTTGQLTVPAAVLVNSLAPIVAGAVYWRLFLRPPQEGTGEDGRERLDGGTLRLLLSYGNRVWLGSVASMLLSRLAQLLMAPLSSVEDLGLYSVATTVSDLPLIVALAIAGALFGVNSATPDAAQTALTSRLTLLVSALGCIVLGVTVPWWITPLFGPEFRGAVVPTLMLLFSAVLCVPGLMAATGIGAWGRPGLRSLGLAITLVINLAVFVLLVPRFGVLGACWTSIASNVVMTAYMTLVAARVMGLPAGDFLLVRADDVRRAWREGAQLTARILRRPVRTGS